MLHLFGICLKFVGIIWDVILVNMFLQLLIVLSIVLPIVLPIALPIALPKHYVVFFFGGPNNNLTPWGQVTRSKECNLVRPICTTARKAQSKSRSKEPRRQGADPHVTQMDN